MNDQYTLTEEAIFTVKYWYIEKTSFVHQYA